MLSISRSTISETSSLSSTNETQEQLPVCTANKVPEADHHHHTWAHHPQEGEGTQPQCQVPKLNKYSSQTLWSALVSYTLPEAVCELTISHR